MLGFLFVPTTSRFAVDEDRGAKVLDRRRRGRCSRPRTTRSRTLGRLDHRRDRGRAARGARRRARAQAEAARSARCGSRSPGAGSRRRCSSRWSCSAASRSLDAARARPLLVLDDARGDVGRDRPDWDLAPTVRLVASLPASERSGVPLGYGVIGSPTDSGSVSLGSSPGTPAVDSTRTCGTGFDPRVSLDALPVRRRRAGTHGPVV